MMSFMFELGKALSGGVPAYVIGLTDGALRWKQIAGIQGASDDFLPERVSDPDVDRRGFTAWTRSANSLKAENILSVT